MVLVTQANSGDRTAWDDCGPSAAAMCIFRATGGAKRVSWREVRADGERLDAFAKDVPNVSNPTSIDGNIEVVYSLVPKAKVHKFPEWAEAVRLLKAGGGMSLAYWYAAAPTRLHESHSGTGRFGHSVYVEAYDDTYALWYDPLRPQNAEPRQIRWDELKVLAHWGAKEANAHRGTVCGYVVEGAKPPVPPKPKPTPSDKELARKELDATLAEIKRTRWGIRKWRLWQKVDRLRRRIGTLK